MVSERVVMLIYIILMKRHNTGRIIGRQSAKGMIAEIKASSSFGEKHKRTRYSDANLHRQQ